MKTLKPQTNYTAMMNGFQLVMPLNCEINCRAIVFNIGEQVLDFVHAFQRHAQFVSRYRKF